MAAAGLRFDQSISVVIGIDQYGNGIAPLRTAVGDAEAIAQILEDEHGYKVERLLDGQATGDGLRLLIHETLPKLLTENSRLLFYFAGHGIALDGDDGPAGYLIPQDARAGATESYLPMTWLHDALTALPCRHFLAVFDCCFAGAFRWSSTRRTGRSPEVIHRERFDRFQQDPAWQVITSASYDQEAWDVFHLQDDRGEAELGEVSRGDAQQQHSPFALGLMQALQGAADTSPPAMNGRPAGDGVITATELYLFLRDHVELLTEGRRKRQTPELCSLRNHDKGEFLFLTPGHALNLPPAPELNAANNPYRGLESFDQAHSDLFFGRDQEIERLLAKVKAMQPLTIVLGASGTGKSSLVKAGLLPRLEKDRAFAVLPVMRPGERPLEALARACAGVRTLSAKKARVLGQKLARDEKLLAKLVERWQEQNPAKTLVLVVDQTEELVTQCREEKEAKQFQRLLTRALERLGQQFRVVVTLRLDFEAQFQQEEWRSVWMTSRFVVPPMSQAQLREAIEEPAAKRVLYFDPPSLVDTLVEDVGQTLGALPLLSFTLSELYLRYLERRSDNRALTEADYDELGGVMGSLTQRATQEYEALVAEDGAYGRTVKNVMLRMVAVEGGELARRRVPRSELVYGSEKENERVQRLLERLIAARLVVQGQEGEEEPYVEPAHDALVRGWDKLLRWKKEEQENLVLQRLLTPASRAWKQTKRNQDLWEKNSRLATLKEISFKGPSWLNQLELDFIEKSWKIKRRNQRFIQASVVGFIAFATGAILISNTLRISANNSAEEATKQGKLALANADEATKQRENAEKNAAEAEAEAKRANEQTKLAEDNLAEAQRQEKIAEKNAAEAKEQAEIAKDNAAEAEKQTKLAEEQRDLAKQRQQEAEEQNIHALVNLNKAFSEANQPLASMVAGVQAWQKIETGDMETDAISLSARIALIRTAYYKDSFYGPFLKQKYHDFPYRKNSQNRQLNQNSLEESFAKRKFLEKNILQGHSSRVLSITFSPDGQMIASSGKDFTINLWNRQGKLLETIRGHRNTVMDVAFSPDSQTIASASLDGTVRLWNIQGELIKVLIEPEAWAVGQDGKLRALDGEYFESVDFNSSGTRIVAASSSSKNINIWDEKAQITETITDESDGEFNIIRAKFSPDGKNIISATDKGTINLWNRQGELVRYIKSHDRILRDIAFNPSGENIASVGDDGVIKIFDLEGTLIKSIDGQNSRAIGSISFSPDGEIIASASDDGFIRLWDLQGNMVDELQKRSGGGRAVAFSPDGRTIASGSESGLIQLWEQSDSPFIELANSYPIDDSTYVGAFSPSLDKIYLVSGDDKIRILRWSGELVKILEGKFINQVRSLAFTPNNNLIAILQADRQDDFEISLWRIDRNQIEVTNLSKSLFWGGFIDPWLFLSPNGDYIAASDSSQRIAVWSVKEKKESWLHVKGDYQMFGGVLPPILSFSPDNQKVAATSTDGKLKVWNNSGDVPKILDGHSKDGSKIVTSLVFSPDSNLLVSANEDGIIKVWNGQGLLLKTMQGHISRIRQIVFVPNNDMFASVGGDGIIKLWSFDGSLLISLEEPDGSTIRKISFSADGKALATFSDSGIIRKWNLNSEGLLNWHCNWLRDYLLYNPDGQKAREEGVCKG